jgi:hypothetical protein
VTLLGLVAGAIAFGQARGVLEGLQRQSGSPAADGLRRALWLLAGGVVLGSLVMTTLMARQARLETRIIAGNVRGAIGVWLHEQARSPSETVFLEPLGYIGFFSNLRMLDYPGLASPEVVAARRRAVSKAYPGSWPELIRDLRPDWLVLRPFELSAIVRKDPQLLGEAYDHVKTFDATPEIARQSFVPVPAFLEYDGTFEIYRRKPLADALTPSGAGAK